MSLYPSSLIYIQLMYIEFQLLKMGFFHNVQLALPCRSIKKIVSQIALSLLLSAVERIFLPKLSELNNLAEL